MGVTDNKDTGTIIEDSTVFNLGEFKIVRREIKFKHGERKTHYFWDRGRQFVVICAITKDGKIVLTRERKDAIWERITGLPAGVIEKGESPEKAAARELLEETGYAAKNLQLIGKQVFDFLNKISYGGHWFFLALDAKYVQKPEITNDVILADLSEIDSLIEGTNPKAEIKTAMSIACLARAQKFLARPKSQSE